MTATTMITAAGGGLLGHLLVLHGPAAYALIGALAFAEAAVFLGFVLPGETAVLLGGVLASQHAVSLPGMAAIVVAAAIGGDTVGYEVGRHFGDRILALPILRRRHRAIDRARVYLRTRGGRAVFLGRFTAFLRAVMPGLAGASRLPYRRFLTFNAAGGLLWGIGFTLLGYAAGASYAKVEKAAGWASTGLLLVFAAGLFAAHRYRARHDPAADPNAAADSDAAADPDRLDTPPSGPGR
ncbi:MULTISPECIES: DedA family protein [unclassified Frankia]|uniref:DedA family protein n=1 Tax=unclassified Frankia TaxID=2632575 RepID=UPI002AD59E95|nr:MULTISPECIES: DedA family protein [unclassified Frankia]